jgi:NADPH-dependent glutamate synthase beta subunit-like oxidoreductase
VAEAQLDSMIDEAKSSAEDAAQEAIEEAGGTFEKNESLGFKLGFDFMEKELVFKVTKTSGYKVELGVAEVEAKKTETVMKKSKSFKKEDAGKGDAAKGDAAKKP